LVHEFELLKQTFWLDVRRNILLYYLQVGGYSAENFFEARSNFKYASTQATFAMVLHFFVFASFHGYWILDHD
jgi:hypothetical protein